MARLLRSSLAHRAPLLGAAAAALVVGAACGGGGSAQPTPSPTVPVASPVASPQRPTLLAPSPSPAASTAAPVAASTPSAAAPAAGGETYTVVSGDTLLKISEKVYNDSTLWRRIYDANKDVIGADPDALKIDMKLRIPPKP